jgi:hypothetical protein
VLAEVEEEEERKRKKKREKREMAKITYRVVLGSLEMVVLQGNMKGGCPSGGGDGGFCIAWSLLGSGGKKATRVFW